MKKCLAFLAVAMLAALPAAAQSIELFYDDSDYETVTALSTTLAPVVQFDVPGTEAYALDSVSFSLEAAASGTYPVSVQIWDDALASVETIAWDIDFTGNDTYTLDLTGAKLPLTSSVRIGIFVREDPLVPVPGTLSLGVDSTSSMPFGNSYTYDSAAVPPTDAWTPDAAANYGIRASVHVVPALNCEGFLSPLNRTLTLKTGGRTLPLKARLFDAEGAPVTRGRLVSPPLVQLLYTSAPGVEPVDVTDSVAPAGRSNKGQAFRNAGNSMWIYNLKTRKTLAGGTYTILMDSGDATEYLIGSTCTGTFAIEAPKKNPKNPK